MITKLRATLSNIQAAFLGSESVAERLRDFRLERIARIRARETPVALAVGPCSVLHIVPINAFATGVRYDLAQLQSQIPIPFELAPMFMTANSFRVNFDGLLVYETDGKKPSDGFTQVYRNGILESVDVKLLTGAERHGREKSFGSLVFEVRLVRSVTRFLGVLKRLGVDPPLVIMFSLADVHGYMMTTRDAWGFPTGSEPFDRDVLSPPEVLMESYDSDVPVVMKPILDSISNAAGRPCMPKVNGSGRK